MTLRGATGNAQPPVEPPLCMELIIVLPSSLFLLRGRFCPLAPVVLLAACGGAAPMGDSGTEGDGTSLAAILFASFNNVALNTTITSQAVTVSGLSVPATIVVNGGQYQIGANGWTSAVGQVSNAQTLRLQHTSSNTNSSDVLTTVTIGTTTFSFRSITVSPGTLPALNQGTLTWTQDNNNPANTWANANTYCAGTTINNQAGWRLPTSSELTNFRLSNDGANVGWALTSLWASDAGAPGFHSTVAMNNSNAPVDTADATQVNFSCVHT